MNFLNGEFHMQKGKLKNQMVKFSHYLVVDKGVSELTAEGYCRTLVSALKRMRRFSPTEKHAKDYIMWMIQKKYSYSSIANTSLSIEHFSKFKGNEIQIGRPRKPKRILKDILSEAEINRLISASCNVREKAIVSLLSFSGIRNKELCTLQVKDVDLGANCVRIVNGKNNKDRIANFSNDCARILIEYLMQYPRENDDFLFTTLVKDNPYATGDTRKLIKKLARRAKIERRVWPHVLRSSLACNLHNRGASLLMIKDQMGHVYIETTMIYVESMPKRNRSEYDYYTPAYI